METTFYSLATKSKFNKGLNHFFAVNDTVEEVQSGKNIADIIVRELDEGNISSDQILPIVGAVIKDKFEYSYDSFNIPKSVTDFNKITDETTKWTAIDILLVYYNPNGDIILINPKNPSHWEKASELYRDQLMVIYSKYIKAEDKDSKIAKEAIKAIEEMIAGKDVFINQEFIDQTVTPKKIVKQEKPSSPASPGSGKKRFTPKYSVLVTNELFHNGNVEAWKKIIESYTTTYPDLEVTIYYDNELINDINSLFKWGKVKSQSLIYFQVSGEDIKGVSKLQKYLFEGASVRFEQFLKLGVGKVLKLF
ncbi:MAG: hypothetical protein JW864_18530 [Spirochaetes bacterium]|nr:hypothetical protein [Spirochaetota bacterium]